jgi:hypothetical protein
METSRLYQPLSVTVGEWHSMLPWVVDPDSIHCIPQDYHATPVHVSRAL